PEGPYLLGGFCNGGLVGYEIAQQLREAGQEVSLLLLIDAGSPMRLGALRALVSRASGLLPLNKKQRFEWFLRLLHAYRYLRYPSYRQTKGVQHSGRKASAASLWRFDLLFPPIEKLRQDWMAIYAWVSADYDITCYPGNVIFFWDSEVHSGKAGWRRTPWRKVVASDQAEECILPGTHTTCRTEHLPELAARLKTKLEEAQNARSIK
ncbi:MAG TPA: thioesterase domain-containing protein, partial [Ktedonobacteraceae bacterium]|nr:thioesterase domain-containing protein [Ktedonobacteraceae bacterium]